MTSLTVLHDPDHPFCRRARGWLGRQPQLVRLDFVPAGSRQALERFPDLDPALTRGGLTAVGERGEVYLGERAWLVCLWALRAWRPVASRTSGSGHRHFLRAAADLAGRLGATTEDNEARGEARQV